MSQAADHINSPADASIPSALEQRVLVLAPPREDAQMCSAILEDAGLHTVACRDIAHVCRELLAGAAALVLTEQSLAPDRAGELAEALGHQPPWSDLPVLVLTGGGAESPTAAWVAEHLDNVILLERPVQRLTLLSAVRAAVKSRQRQYQLREYLAEQKRQHEAMRESERQLRFVCESIPHLVWTARPDGYIDYANQRVLDYTGARPEELAGWDWLPYIHPEDRQPTIEHWEDALRSGNEVKFSYRIRQGKTGEYRWYAVHALPLRDGAGRILRWYGTCTDIDEQKRAEEALRQSEEKFAKVFTGAPAAVTLSRLEDGAYLEVNDTWVAMHGYSREEAIGRSSVAMGIWPTPEARARFVQALKEKGALTEWEEQFRRKSGETFIVQVSAQILNVGGEQLMVASFVDITRRKQAEAALRHAVVDAQRFREALDNVPAYVYMKDLQFRYLYANRLVLELFGCTAEEVVGRDDYCFFPPDSAQRLREIDQRVIAGRQSIEEFVGAEIGERRRVYLEYKTPIYAEPEGKTICGLLGIATDITERKEAEERLREREALLQKAISAPTVGVLFFNLDGHMRKANQAFEQMSGYSSEELANATHWQTLTAPEFWELTERTATELAEKGVVAPYEKEMVRKDGSRWWGLFTPTRLSGSGWNTECVEFVIDITERKRAETELVAAKRAAEQANAAKDHFLAVLSHELRTPLTPVLPALEELARQVSEEVREDVEMARRNVELEARLIDDLLDVTRISRGKIELHREVADLEMIVRRAAEVCAPDIEARRLHFDIKVEGGPYPVEADPARLQQVFWNLLKNAIKFTPHGGCVGIHCHSLDGQVVVQVKDSGMGIEPEALSRIFNAFEQVDRAVTRQFGGLGLGLAISRALVELHGGTIQTESEGVGKGATFTVKLPIHKVAESGLPSPELGRPAGGTQAPTPARRLRILLVEDHGDTARIMRRMLQMRGHQVETAGDVATALELVQERPFDLLLSDLGLPDRSGLELMQELHRMGRDIPGIALSGYGQDDDIRRSREVGFLEHLTKPVNFGQLEAAIGRAASAHSSRER